MCINCISCISRSVMFKNCQYTYMLNSDSLGLSTVGVIFITTYQLQTIHVSVLEYLFTFVFNCDTSLCFLINVRDLFSRHKVAAGSCHLENKVVGMHKLNYLFQSWYTVVLSVVCTHWGKKKIWFSVFYICVCVCLYMCVLFTHISSHYTSEFKNIKEHIQHILK